MPVFGVRHRAGRTSRPSSVKESVVRKPTSRTPTRTSSPAGSVTWPRASRHWARTVPSGCGSTWTRSIVTVQRMTVRLEPQLMGTVELSTDRVAVRLDVLHGETDDDRDRVTGFAQPAVEG